jgi:isoleucyl-tRNA synthetase
MIDLKEIEKQILSSWDKNKIYEKSVKKNKKGKKFYFLQGPPYTSGRLHIGHAWNNSLKDVIMRYKRLQGFDVWDRAGYDMHGLPTANAVQKKLKLKDKDEILEYGLDKFVKECQEFSVANAKQMDEDLKRFGIWMDYDNAYLPVTNEFMSSEWLLIKTAHEQKRLYKGKKVMQWCADCETSLAKHELEYENLTDNSIYVEFKLKDKEGSLVIWTTTPWTIPFNLAVMVNPKIDYVKLKNNSGIFYVAKDLAEKFSKEILEEEKYKIIETIKGKEMVGWEYIHPFSDVVDYNSLKKDSPKIHTVLLSSKYVNTESGTGLVHCAPGCGPEDYEVGRDNKIKPFNNIDEKGVFHDSGEFNNLVAKKDDEKFIQALDERRALLGQEKISHEYAHCWRCHKPVVFRATEQWFMKIEDLVKKIIDYNKKIKWVPDFAKKSYELWIENLRDNGLTRQRFWGTPMPVWTCKHCEEIEVIGSVEELEKKATKKLPINLHKPWIDKIKIKCKCGEEMSRVPDVLDVWIDSGTASWNCLYYPQEKKYFEKYFPADMILEATEQTKLWFSMLQISSAIMFKKSCYENVYAHGMIFDFGGTKMSKSLGNIISPYEVVDKYSSDIFRYYICEMNAGENINFNWEEVKQKQRNLNVLMNVQNYFLGLVTKPVKKIDSKKLNMEEKYILSRANSAIKKVTEHFDKYELDKTITEIEKLFLDLSRVYIKITRDKSNEDATKNMVASVIWKVYEDVLKMFSVVCPLVTDYLWEKLKEKKIVKEESIHLSSWPKFDSKKINKKLEEEFEKGLEIIEKGLAERDKIQIGLKWPLAKATINCGEKLDKELQKIISKQLNVREIKLKKEKTISVELDSKLTPELEAEGYAREMSRQIQAFRKKSGLEKDQKIELWLIVDEEFKKILDSQKDFIEKRTNSKKLEIVTTSKERFKKRNDFKIKNKRGEIGLVF